MLEPALGTNLATSLQVSKINRTYRYYTPIMLLLFLSVGLLKFLLTISVLGQNTSVLSGDNVWKAKDTGMNGSRLW